MTSPHSTQSAFLSRGRRARRRLPAATPAMVARSARPEAEVLAELCELCATPGYAHIVALLSLRDNFIFFQGKMTTAAMANIYSTDRLIRTEMSLLIGFMARAGADAFADPPANATSLFERTHALLQEVHDSIHVPMAVVRNGDGGAVALEERGTEALREPIFYGGESAFNFQYADFAVPKYARDSEWLVANRGFDLGHAVQVAAALENLMPEKARQAIAAVQESKGLSWSVLPGFLFTVAEVLGRVALSEEIVRAVLAAFALPHGDLNAGFEGLNDFNAAVATPLLPVGEDEFALLQWYPLVEALYEAPFYWMGADKAYKATAFTHRGAFTEDFAFERLCAVFGADHVYRNVNLERGKTRVGEIDVLVAWAGRAIVVQAKSKRLTIEARRGNDIFLRKDFQGAVQDAYDQALLCSEALFDPSVRLTTAEGVDIALADPVTEAFPLCLVADHYPALVIQVDRFLSPARSIGSGPR
jgi:predicted RecB family endonuclease